MANRVFVPVRGKRLRITTLDNCGRVPASGAIDAFLVTDGFISVNLSTVVEEGTQITERKITGAICVNERSADNFMRFTVELTFCGVNPDLVPLVSNAKGYFDAAADNVGFTIAEGEIEKWFALELWTGLAGAACDEEDEEASGYMLLPFVQGGTLGDISVDGENSVTFSMTGAYTKGGNAWGVGPYSVAAGAGGTAAKLPTALDSLDHFLMMRTGIAPPPMADEMQPMPSA